jgi:hypothetical protein
MGNKNLQHAFLRRGSKAVGMLKIPSKYEQRYFVRPNSSFPSPSSSCLATRWLVVACQRALVEEYGVFPCWYYYTIVLHARIAPGGWIIGPLVAAVQRHSLTSSIWTSSSVLQTILFTSGVSFCYSLLYIFDWHIYIYMHLSFFLHRCTFLTEGLL